MSQINSLKGWELKFYQSLLMDKKLGLKCQMIVSGKYKINSALRLIEKGIAFEMVRVVTKNNKIVSITISLY